MMNIVKQIEYWKNGSMEDIESAELLIQNNRLLHGLFWCHLATEKIIKAHIVKCTLQVPPKSHNLLWLLEKTQLVIDPVQEKLIGELMVYQLEGRYPENFPSHPGKIESLRILNEVKTFTLWLMNKL